MSSVLVSAEPRSASRPRRLYTALGIVALIIAVMGFWPTYFGPLLAGTLHTVPLIHLHATVFVGWLLLVIAQATLAARGHRALHIKVGRFGFVYGAFVVLIGLATAFDQFAMRIAAGEVQQAQDRLFVPLTDMVVFAPILAAAWLYRHQPQVHKRLIVVATTILLIAAVHRMTFVLGERPIPPYRILLVWLSPIYVGMIYDWVKLRTIHPVYLIGIAAIVYLKFFRMPLFESAVWKNFSRWLVEFYR